MRTKVTLVLLILNAALFYFIFFVRGSFKIEADPNVILGPQVANLQALAITSADGANTRLERRDDIWVLTAPVTWPANKFAVNRILNELQFLRSESSFAVADLEKGGQKLADYGLASPPLQLAFTPAAVPGSPEAAPIVLRIGNSTTASNRLYILSPDGARIHVVPRSLAESLTRSLEELRSDELFTIPVFEARTLLLEPASGGRIRFRRDNDRWLTDVVIETRASKVATELTLSRLRALRVQNFVPPALAEPLRAELATPALRITVEGNNRRETLLLGPPAPPATAGASAPAPAPPTVTEEAADPAPPPEPATLHYAIMETDAAGMIANTDPAARPTLFTVAVPDTFLSTLRNAQRELRETRILDFDPAALTTLTLAAPGEPDLVLQRLEAPASSAWQIVRGTAQQLETAPADREIVERVINELARLSAEEFIDVASEAQREEFGFNRPTRTVTLATASSAQRAAATATLLLTTSAKRESYAKLAHQDFIYRVSPEILNELPVDPLVYRLRFLRELPTGTPFTALKLTDLANDTTLLETTLEAPMPAPATPATPPAAGGASGPPAPSSTPPASADATSDTPAAPFTDAQRAAIDTVVAQLRTLRAKKFVSGEFTKTVVAAGEERPWRYRLEATLRPAGGPETRVTTSVLFLSERAGGGVQLAGSPEFDVVFEIEQPFLDALFALIPPPPPNAPEE